jgi:predicted cation transporter
MAGAVPAGVAVAAEVIAEVAATVSIGPEKESEKTETASLTFGAGASSSFLQEKTTNETINKEVTIFFIQLKFNFKQNNSRTSNIMVF